MNRQRPVRTGTSLVAALLRVAAAAAVPGAQARAQGALPYPDVADVSHASPGVAANFRGFFNPKSAHDPKALVDRFSKDGGLYIDATSGGIWPTWDSLNAIFTNSLPKIPSAGLSYPIRILGDEKSAPVCREAASRLRRAGWIKRWGRGQTGERTLVPVQKIIN